LVFLPLKQKIRHLTRPNLIFLLIFLLFISTFRFAYSRDEILRGHNKVLNNSAKLNESALLNVFPLSNSNRVSSQFGWRISPFTGVWENHHGIDLPADMGTPILAINAGDVSKAGFTPGYGKLVELDHGNGYQSKYGHASKIFVQAGQKVQKGQIIALVGSTGNSTGPHLHFEISQNGIAFNPSLYFEQEFRIISADKEYLNTAKFEDYFYRGNQPNRNTKKYFLTGDLVVSIRVRSGKTKW
jgi:hypothetical protein